MNIVGSSLVIPNGTYVYTMHPSKEHGYTTRKRTIIVDRVSKYSEEITWAGSGKYWNWCYPTRVMIDANPTLANALEALMLAHNGYKEACKHYG